MRRVTVLSPRTETILKSIVEQYVTKALPVSSQGVLSDSELGISAATVRNEMVNLEQEGYITRSYFSAGSIPSDRGYRYYVESLGDVKLPLTEQRLISHLFHQVEVEVEEWLSLAATIMAQMVRNMAVATMPRPVACRFRYLELISLQGTTVLVVLVLRGAKVKQQLITFDQIISQPELTAIANKLNAAYSGLASFQISTKGTKLLAIEQQVTDCSVKMMKTEDSQRYEESYLEGISYTLSQPEFARNRRLALVLVELVEQRALLRSILPPKVSSGKVQVIIGKENRSEMVHDYSVVISQYGLPEEAVGTIGVIGPTRMSYARAIATVSYLSSVLSELEARLYGRVGGGE